MLRKFTSRTTIVFVIQLFINVHPVLLDIMEQNELSQDSLSDLEKQKGRIERKINRLEKSERVAARKRETRRKIVAGALVLTHAEINEEFGLQLERLLERFVRDRDRELFDLPALEKNEARARETFNGDGAVDAEDSWMSRDRQELARQIQEAFTVAGLVEGDEDEPGEKGQSGTKDTRGGQSGPGAARRHNGGVISP